MSLSNWRFNSQLKTLPDHENITVIRETFEAYCAQIPRVNALLPYEFQYNYATYIKQHWPSLWVMGGVFEGNRAFELWGEYRRGTRNDKIAKWETQERCRYRSLHHNDFLFKAVIGAIKWSITLEIGESMMFKCVIREAIKKKLIKK